MALKGQSFVLMAIIFSSIMILLAVNLNFHTFHDDGSTIRDFYNQGLSQMPGIFNQALEENSSTQNAKQSLYSYNRYLDRETQTRGLDYNTVNIFLLPEKGKLTVINYQDRSETIRVDGDINFEEEVLGKQYYTKDFGSGEVEITVSLEDTGVSESFNASSPRIFTYMQMSSSSENWVNHEVK